MLCTSVCAVKSYEVLPDIVNGIVCAPVDPVEPDDAVPAKVTMTVTVPVPFAVTWTCAT
jgi:hypothetical protein